MNSSPLRRLAADHSALHTSPLPPYYLFPPSSGIPDDLTQLTILLAGPNGTPYTKGLWKLHLKIPEDYPKSPPKAAFRTRIWHPNVEEVSGAVCVDTLKRDWEARLTLRDVLITISCLLIHPNPDSALNSAAGHLLQEEYSAFAHQASLMTSIHARAPPDLAAAVQAAKQRGEDTSPTAPTKQQSGKRKTASTSMIKMKTPAHLSISQPESSTRSISAPMPHQHPPSEEEEDSSGAENDENAENDPSLSPSPVTIPTLSPRRPTLQKRPLSDLPTPPEPDDDDDNDAEACAGGTMSPSEQNIAANQQPTELKLAERSRSGANLLGNSWQQDTTSAASGECAVVFFDADERPKKRICSADGKENAGEALANSWPHSPASGARPATASCAARQIAAPAAMARKAKARAGLRRL